LDEIHKIPSWSDIVKSLWDEDSRSGSALRVMVLGSSPLLIARGLTESLAGRFELTRLPHWSFTEMRQAFGWDDVDRYVFYGGYPGAAGLVAEPGRWRRYIQDSMIETTLSRDVLLLQPIQKPALLRQLFRLGCDYSSQELSFRQMTRQLEDAGSTVTLAHYLELLSGAGMLTGLEKFSGTKVVQRSSSPKLLVMNTALMSASLGKTFDELRGAPELWGRLVESAGGAHLLAGIHDVDAELFYWRDGQHEVDFVVRRGRQVMAIEVTSGRRKRSMEGMAAFVDRFGPHFEIQTLLVGGQGLDLADFLSRSVGDLLG
jgi:predicted AAA+ superfamily ATPase